jgi:hypothetical protein
MKLLQGSSTTRHFDLSRLGIHETFHTATYENAVEEKAQRDEAKQESRSVVLAGNP